MLQAQAAYAFGRSGDLVADLLAHWQGFYAGLRLAPVIVLDQNRTEAFIAQLTIEDDADGIFRILADVERVLDTGCWGRGPSDTECAPSSWP